MGEASRLAEEEGQNCWEAAGEARPSCRGLLAVESAPAGLAHSTVGTRPYS